MFAEPKFSITGKFVPADKDEIRTNVYVTVNV